MNPIPLDIIFAMREDGGMRVWSPQLPGLCLSHHNPFWVVADIRPAIQDCASYWLRPKRK